MRSDSWPAILVNWSAISQKEIESYYDSSINYYDKALIAYGSDPTILEKENAQKEIKIAVMEKLIENKLIYAEVKKRVGKDLEEIADQKIENATKNVNMQEQETAVSTVYGMNFEDYKEKELIPQAYKEILEGRMTLTNEDFNKWLADAEKNAKIFILIPGYSWDGKSVKI